MIGYGSHETACDCRTFALQRFARDFDAMSRQMVPQMFGLHAEPERPGAANERGHTDGEKEADGRQSVVACGGPSRHTAVRQRIGTEDRVSSIWPSASGNRALVLT